MKKQTGAKKWVKGKAFFRELWPTWFGSAVHLSLLVDFSKVWCTMRAKLWMKLERGSVSFLRNIGKVKMWRWLSTVQRWCPLKVSKAKIWGILFQSRRLIGVIHIDQQKVPGVAWKERRVWCNRKHWSLFAIGCHFRRSKRKLEELKR